MVVPGRMVAMGLAALLIGGVGIAVAATRDPDTKVASVAPAPVDVQPDVTTSSTVPPSAGNSPPSTSPPTTQVEVTSTTARRATTTTVARLTTTTGPRGSTTSTTTMPCTAAQIAVTATTDKVTYGSTEQVKLESTLRNRSSTACSYTSYTFRATFADPAGRPIIDSAQIADAFRPTALVPGAVLTATIPFDPRTCQTQPCPPLVAGTYSAIATWTFPGGPFEVRAPFAFTA